MKNFWQRMKKKEEQSEMSFNALQVLESVPLLSGLSPDERTKLCSSLKKVEYKEGSYIMKEGEDGNTFYIIVSGKVQVLTLKNGNEQIVATLESGDYAGEQALLSNAKRNASLRAHSAAVVCLECQQKAFKKILASNTSIRFAKRDAKRKAFVTAIKMDEDEKFDETNLLDDKTVAWLLKCVEKNDLFNQIDMKQRKEVLRHMKLDDTIKCGDFVIKQGDQRADKFFVVESGEYDVLKDGVKVFHYSRGGAFGELALLQNAPRAASVTSISKNGKNAVWYIRRNYFRKLLTSSVRRKNKENISFLKTVPLFKPLLQGELAYLNDALSELNFVGKKGEEIFKEGDEGDMFYVIKQGSVQWSKKQGSQSGILKKSQFFGERALRTKQTRAATICIASNESTVLLCMDSGDFQRLLGPVIELIDDKIKEYKRSDKMSANSESHQSGSKKNKLKKADPALAQSICKLTELKTIGVLGKGGFGLVTLVVDPNTNRSYALKSICKSQVIELELEKHIISEKKVMDMLENRFLVNLNRTYKDKLRVYFLLDVCLGGELFTILRQRRYFNEPTARFYAASVCEGFDYMHSLNIIYRDLKPENLVLDSDGYLKITDFGFAKVCRDKTFTLCGTPDYLCPEIVTGQGHGKGVDWWTLGILIYEMLASFPPFVADDPIETYRKIIRGRIRFPRYFSQEVRDLIRGLLHNKPTRRLGVLRGGADNIRKHAWYKNFDWQKLVDAKMPAPIINKVKSDFDLTNFTQISVDQDEAKPIDPKDDFAQCF